ncbi:MAG: hypothetical protein IJL97_01920 [Lachnospiraceae bacterium]|nr:hypothetical protein [Lachnospiraceae bacterium]
MADMFEANMMRPKNLQYIGALGAALMAGVGTGLFKDFAMAAEVTKSDDITAPNPENTAAYRKLLPVYRKFYEALMPVYKELQDITI